MKNLYTIRIFDDCYFDLKIESPLTRLTGDSGTGKTLLFKALAGITLNDMQDYVTGVAVKDIRICLNERELGNVLNQHHKFIFIDKYDVFSTEAKVRLSKNMLNSENNWIVASRNMDLPNTGLMSRGIKKICRKRENGVWRLYLEPYR